MSEKHTISDFSQVFSRFGGAARLAREIGIESCHARTMRARGSIPPAYWTRIVAAAARLRIDGITFERLAALAARGHAVPARNTDAPAA